MSGAAAEAGSPAVVEVAVPVPLHQTFDYLLRERGVVQPAAGTRVLVPFGPRTLTGFVLGVKDRTAAPGVRLREVIELLDERPLLGDDLLDLCRWASEYYLAPIGEVLRAAVPSGIERALEKRVSLTEEGRLRMSALKGAEAKVAAALSRGPRAWRDVARYGVGRIESMARVGLVEIGGAILPPRVKAREEPFARLARVPSQEEEHQLSRAPKQRALLAALSGGEERAVRDLRYAHGPVADPLSRLVDKGMVEVTMRQVVRDPFRQDPIPHPPPELTKAQAEALGALSSAVASGRYAPFLLHGVTGSGKTEVYLRAIEDALGRGRTALVLVPEISLTPQLTQRFRGRFGDQVAVLHSGLSDAERYDQWRRIRGELGTRVKIAVGARSAIFAPLESLGVIVVDEEHDGSFKQEESPRYHARDLALVRARQAGAVVILGSATPSMESRYNVQAGKLTRLRLPERVRAQPMPRMDAIDLRKATFVGHRSALLSSELADAVGQTVRAGEQVILFLNRRGYSSFVKCRDCGEIYECRDCSVSLTHHQRRSALLCHYCGYAEPVPKTCRSCGGERVGLLGVGTERIEDALRALVPEARVGRLDRDTVTSRARMEGILRGFSRQEIDVLVGTQMVAKGHDFPGVTLVGVILADQGLHVPDFRSAERTFQLLCQVSGRAGRGDRGGRVLVQTFVPGHPAIVAALDGDEGRFISSEASQRSARHYPPFGRLVAIRFDGKSPAATRRSAEAIAARARVLLRSEATGAEVDVLGPAEAPLSRLKGRHRYHLLLKSSRGDRVRGVARALLDVAAQESTLTRGVRMTVDVDPMNLL